jgi:N-acetyl-anhydromuramyl-L-alanine amidase AmpD
MTTYIEINSPNYEIPTHTRSIKYIILHYTEMLFDDALSKLCDLNSKVSTHYLIRDNGSIYNLVRNEHIAWHAGLSSWHNTEKLNNNSIGIEIDNLGNQAFTNEQITSCINLCRSLMNIFNIPKENVIGHSDIAPDRKIDPGIFFPWKLLSTHNIGIECNTNRSESTIPPIAEIQLTLQRIGYKIDITNILDKQTNYVFRAFQSHFCQEVILNKGGVDYFRNPESIFEWTKECQHTLNNINLK